MGGPPTNPDKRLLTVVLQVEDAVSAALIWEAHRGRTLLAGCNVLTIANGDLVKQIEQAVDEGYAHATRERLR